MFVRFHRFLRRLGPWQFWQYRSESPITSRYLTVWYTWVRKMAANRDETEAGHIAGRSCQRVLLYAAIVAE